jgi:hypothetical protein
MKTNMRFCAHNWLGRNYSVGNPQPEISAWGIRSEQRNNLGETSVIVSPRRTPRQHMSHWSQKSEVTGAIHKGKILANAPELLSYAYIS